MTPRAFEVWAPSLGQSREDARTVTATDAKQAAVEMGERRWSDNDHPDEQTFIVRSPEGDEEVYVVLAEPSVHFRARRCTHPRRRPPRLRCADCDLTPAECSSDLVDAAGGAL